MTRLGQWFFRNMHEEPVVMWSLIIGTAGVVFPIVIPPIRETFAAPKNTQPLQPMKVAKALSGKQ
eukprot:CAMPEP_0197489086 /NCGR_PEP_ID=MMETSP1311-20131121/3956_1 /TAXON_ID=464262 /ORGANISM="Genus nov. species nov., Strain RCC856" /LENGTH=64 /DNA_ID=CAMNT_0043033335 /DNA_START=107 /DNA_END=301 /DNA_ORIENTATION=+